MDVECANGTNGTGCNLQCDSIVFVDLSCRLPISLVERLRRRGRADGGLEILRGASGVLRAGRLTYILGPSGAGKSTLLQILAGRRRTGVSGLMPPPRPGAVLVQQHASLLDALTGAETLHFAAALKLSHATRKERSTVIDRVSRQLGIQDVLETRVGRMSGGERRRVTVATELLTDPPVLLLDEPTSGLDSVSSLAVARALQAVARGGRVVACVVHQPSSRVFAAADEVVLLSGGRTLYAGAAAAAPAALARAGLVCPQYYNMADYLLEVAAGEHGGDAELLRQGAQRAALEAHKLGTPDHESNGKGAISETAALLGPRSAARGRCAAGARRQLSALLWRCSVGALRDIHLTQVRVACHLAVALLLGALYGGAGGDGARVASNTACLFFFLLFLFFSNAMPTIHTFPLEASVVLQEHLNRWYSLHAYCLSKILADLPLQLVCATVFAGPAWWLTSQPAGWHRAAAAWLVCALVTVLAQTFGLVFGAAFGVKLGLFAVPAANIPMLMFSEFFIPYKEIPSYLQPFSMVSYFRYAFDGLMVTVYGFDRPKMPCSKSLCFFRDPKKYVEYIGLSMDYRGDVIALVVWILVLQVSLFLVLTYKVHRSCR